MAASMWDASLRASFAARAGKLTPASKAGWGKFSVGGMMAHLNDSYRMALGELIIPSKNLPLRYPPIKQLVIYLLPFPKSAPTAPQLLTRCDGAVLADEQLAMLKMLDKLAAVKPGDPLQEHPAFGVLSHRAYGVLMARHTDHHLKQFGV
jgi:uncharacterized protein DUF1569